MMDFLYRIPEALGWAIVAAFSFITVFLLIRLIKTFIEMWHDWHEDEEEERG